MNQTTAGTDDNSEEKTETTLYSLTVKDITGTIRKYSSVIGLLGISLIFIQDISIYLSIYSLIMLVTFYLSGILLKSSNQINEAARSGDSALLYSAITQICLYFKAFVIIVVLYPFASMLLKYMLKAYFANQDPF